MTFTLDPCADCATCAGCGRSWCRAEDVSPGEVDGICSSCFETEDDDA